MIGNGPILIQTTDYSILLRISIIDTLLLLPILRNIHRSIRCDVFFVKRVCWQSNRKITTFLKKIITSLWDSHAQTYRQKMFSVIRFFEKYDSQTCATIRLEMSDQNLFLRILYTFRLLRSKGEKQNKCESGIYSIIIK